jgi:hypothetical protein
MPGKPAALISLGVGVVAICVALGAIAQSTAPSSATHRDLISPFYSPCATTCIGEPSLAAGQAGFTAALAEWRLAPSRISSAFQGLPLERAIQDLELGAHVDGNPGQYGAAIRELKAMLQLPDAMDSMAQAREWSMLTAELDRFFGTPRLPG